MNAFADLHFLRPWWLLALAVVPLAWFVWRHARSEAGAWRAVIDAHLLPFLIDATPDRARPTAAWLGAIAWTLACIALAGPAWERESLPLYRNDAARVLALELAPTMLAADLKPTRLERARYKINDILVASRDMQTALIGYAGDAFVAAPLTDDINTVRNLVDSLDPGVMPVVGNATERAIEEAARLIAQAGLARGELVLIADSASAAALAAAREAQAKGLTVSVLGIGTPAGAPVPLPQGGFLQDANGNIVLPKLDESSLRALAAAGGGRYARLSSDRSDLDALFGDTQARGEARGVDGGQGLSERFRDRGPWVVLALLPFALLAFRRGWMVVLVLAIVPLPEAQAVSFADLWQRPDQQAAAALAAGDAARARQLARDPALRGSAAWRAEDFDAANAAFAQARGADAEYNRGNALARLGKYDEALAAYDRALAEDPQMEDAIANRAAVEEWLKREQQKKDPQQQGDNKDASKSDQGDDAEPQQGGGESAADDASPPQDAQQGEPQQDPAQGKANESSSTPSPANEEATRPDAGSTDASAQKAEAAQREQQQQALSQAIDEELGKPRDAAPQAPGIRREDETAAEQQQAMKQWLQRVPDDPGGLLRRKFQLEHERRQRGGGGR